MQMNQLRPAGEFARNYGCKALVFGPPGSGKTPVLNSAPRPVLLAVEPGLLSMKGSTVPTFQAESWIKIVEFFDWLFASKEANNFDTIGIDSYSQICEIYLRDNAKPGLHGLQLYGKMATECYDIAHKLYYMKQKHMYLICKQQEPDKEGVDKKRPYFPGNDLNIRLPHLYDAILRLDRFNIVGVQPSPVQAFQCKPSMQANCRDRSGMLNEYEPADLTALFAKTMG